MEDFDQKLSKNQAVDQAIEEALPDETLEHVAGGLLETSLTCRAGLPIKSGGCRRCRYYRTSSTHWCEVLEKKQAK